MNCEDEVRKAQAAPCYCPPECCCVCDPPINDIGNTLYRDEYQPHKYGPAAAIRYPDNLRFSDQPFIAETMYRNTYIPHEINRTEKIVNENHLENPYGPFDADTLYRSEYIRKNGVPAGPIRYNDNLTFSDQPFDGNTVYRRNYKPEAYSKIPQINPRDNITISSKRMPDSTQYRDEFIPFKGDRYPAMPHPNNLKFEGPFNDNTHYRSEYVGREGCRDANYKKIDNLRTGPYGLHGQICRCICPPGVRPGCPKKNCTPPDQVKFNRICKDPNAEIENTKTLNCEKINTKT